MNETHLPIIHVYLQNLIFTNLQSFFKYIFAAKDGYRLFQILQLNQNLNHGVHLYIFTHSNLTSLKYGENVWFSTFHVDVFNINFTRKFMNSYS